MSDPLKRLEFLIGKWKGRAEGQFGEKGVIESHFECSHEPSEVFIAMIGESRTNSKLVNKSAAYLTWDPNISKYIRKSMYSYGLDKQLSRRLQRTKANLRDNLDGWRA